MAKFYGKVGYAETVETPVGSGIWVESIAKKDYYGDVLRNKKLIQNSNEINDNINISNQISIVADPFAYKNFHLMRYVEFMGTKWKVSDVEVQYPRLVLSLGGVYNEESSNLASDI